MNVDVAGFYSPRQRVMVLPDIARPRLFLTSHSAVQRWLHSGLYPAFRPEAQLYRLWLRAKAALGLSTTWVNEVEAWALGDFVESCCPTVEAAVVLVGTPGPAQKVTVQLWGASGVVGYLKYAEKPAAKARLEHEYRVLSALPEGLAPKPLKYGPFAKGTALVTEPAAGKPLPARIVPSEDVKGLLASLQQTEALPVERHPWVTSMRERHASTVDPWLEPLAGRVWPVAIQHGDFAPWNLYRGNAGVLKAIDWEYGKLQGFPKLDLAFYLLQVAALMRRWSPSKASDYAVRYLAADGLTHAQARALVHLAAFEAYQQALRDGHKPEAQLQRWRRAVWEKSA